MTGPPPPSPTLATPIFVLQGVPGTTGPARRWFAAVLGKRNQMPAGDGLTAVSYHASGPEDAAG